MSTEKNSEKITIEVTPAQKALIDYFTKSSELLAPFLAHAVTRITLSNPEGRLSKKDATAIHYITQVNQHSIALLIE